MVKTNLFYSGIAALLLLLLNGCHADDDTDNSGGNKLPVVQLTAEHVSTRTWLTGETGTIKWSATDAVSVNGTTSTATTLSDEGVSATFTVAATPTYYVFYPAAMVTSFDATAHTYSVTLPATQAYRDNYSFADNVNPAVATSNDTYLSFNNVCGMLRVPVNTNVVATKARLVTNEAICGAATVDPSAATVTLTGTTKAIDITSLPGTAALTLNWVLPAGTYTAGWKVQLLDVSNNVLAEKVGTGALTIQRSKITLATNSESNPVSVKAGIKLGDLYWAKGNLVAPTTSSYTFAAAQETYTGTSAGGYYFCWNTLNSQATSSSNTTGDWDATTDPCAKVAPEGSWRSPSSDELDALIGTGAVWAQKGTTNGCWFGTTDAATAAASPNSYVFLPAAGSRADGATTMSTVGTIGRYYSATPIDTDDAYILSFDASNISITNSSVRNYGSAVRCVSDK